MPTTTTHKTVLGFESVKDPTLLIPVLKERHPVSCLMYNQVIQFTKYGWNNDTKFYTIGKEINSTTWIISNCMREDWGCNYGISTPNSIIEGTEEIPTEIKEFFSSGSLINWENLDDLTFFMFPKTLANMIYDLSVNIKGNVTEVHPCYLFYMEMEDARQLEISHDKDVEVRRLNPTKNEGDFILQTWHYTIPGSEIQVPKSISRNASGGVFIDGKCVCGVYIPGNGFLSGLFCLKEHRKRGYAKTTMNYTFKEYANDGCIPCLTVEFTNPGGIIFHENLGLKVATVTYGVFIKKLKLD